MRDDRREMVLVNQTQQLPFGVLATGVLFDLCATGRQTRGLPRHDNKEEEYDCDEG